MRIAIRTIISVCVLHAGFAAHSTGAEQPEPNKATEITGNILFVADLPKDTTVTNPAIDTSFYRINTTYKLALARLKQQANAIKDYIAGRNFNTEYCFLVDMSIPSGKNRFFIYNLEEDKLVQSSLVAHGFGSVVPGSYDQLVFSNEPDSYKTSLGRYSIGAAYKGSFGLSYKLHGLDSTNDKAYERTIVLHADKHVPEKEPFPAKIYQSAGCPTVSPGFLKELTNYIKSSKKPILLWIYYS